MVGPAQAKLYAWRMQGSVFAGVVIKLGLRWGASGERMVSAGSVPIVEEARHHKGNFAHSPIYPTDIVPYRPHADLIVDATAHPVGGASTVMPRLLLERGDRPVIDKRLLVETTSGPVPLRWEHTHRGADNPFGGTEAKITDPRRPHTPAGFGPEPLVVQRQRFSKAPDGLVELPAGTRAEVFQSAPADQRCEHFDGSEWLTLEAMHPEVAHLRVGLPAVRAHAVVAEAPATTWAPLRVVADLLAVQPASQSAVMTWRGWLSVSSVDVLRRLRWAVTVARPDETVAWPSVAEVARRPPSTGRVVSAAPAGGATLEGAGPSETASPYAISAPGSGRAAEAPLPGAPWDAGPAAVVVMPQPGDTTAEPAAQPDPFAVSDAAATVGVHTEEPSTRRPEDPFATTDGAPAPTEEPSATVEPESATLEAKQAAETERRAREQAEAEWARREVAAREAEERARFEAEEAQRRQQDDRKARLTAERERRDRMMSRLYGFKLQDR